jgi:hypothetical protein
MGYYPTVCSASRKHKRIWIVELTPDPRHASIDHQKTDTWPSGAELALQLTPSLGPPVSLCYELTPCALRTHGVEANHLFRILVSEKLGLGIVYWFRKNYDWA